MYKALLIIDVQNDFCEGGILPAINTLSIIQPLNDLIRLSLKKNIICVFTRDWHPPDHISFVSQGGPWPPHCIQGSEGAEFARDLFVPNSSLVIDIEKDSNRKSMSYSAFENTSLDLELHQRGILEIAVTGIATEYCVKATVLDALRYGFHTSVLTDVIRPINVAIGDDKKALNEMKNTGAILSTSKKWMSQLK